MAFIHIDYRVYILMRIDKLFSLFNAQLETLGKADVYHSLTGIVLIYPSTVLLGQKTTEISHEKSIHVLHG